MFENAEVKNISMKFGLLLKLLLVCITVSLSGCTSKVEQSADGDKNESPITISVEIQFDGQGDDQVFDLKVAEGMTVFGVLKQLQTKHQIKVEMSGSGETGFISSIGGVSQQGGGGKGWNYLVNDQLAKIGSDLYELKDRDRVLWRYGKYKPE